MNNNIITLAMTGASGSIYGLQLLKHLVAAKYQVYVLISKAARIVLATEYSLKLPINTEQAQRILANYCNSSTEQIIVCSEHDWFSIVASGSSAPTQMVICPCSMGCVAAISSGMSDNLIERAADVVLKERGQLLLVVRETPFSTIHLENMLKLSKVGVTIMPAAPAFYLQPQSIDDLVDFLVARILDHLNIAHNLSSRWEMN